VTPDERYVLVANWCSWELSVIDAATAKVVATLPMGAYPRGVAISPDSSTAYVAIMGGDSVVKVNLANLAKGGSFVVGENPRHLVMDPAGRYLYASLNAPGEVVKIDLTDDQIVGSAHTGVECRSLAISTDGTALYVVNYRSNTITKSEGQRSFRPPDDLNRCQSYWDQLRRHDRQRMGCGLYGTDSGLRRPLARPGPSSRSRTPELEEEVAGPPFPATS
jgi:YVTN family beta-propeller protein